MLRTVSIKININEASMASCMFQKCFENGSYRQFSVDIGRGSFVSHYSRINSDFNVKSRLRANCADILSIPRLLIKRLSCVVLLISPELRKTLAICFCSKKKF